MSPGAEEQQSTESTLLEIQAGFGARRCKHSCKTIMKRIHHPVWRTLLIGRRLPGSSPSSNRIRPPARTCWVVTLHEARLGELDRQRRLVHRPGPEQAHLELLHDGQLSRLNGQEWSHSNRAVCPNASAGGLSDPALAVVRVVVVDESSEVFGAVSKTLEDSQTRCPSSPRFFSITKRLIPPSEDGGSIAGRGARHLGDGNPSSSCSCPRRPTI